MKKLLVTFLFLFLTFYGYSDSLGDPVGDALGGFGFGQATIIRIAQGSKTMTFPSGTTCTFESGSTMTVSGTFTIGTVTITTANITTGNITTANITTGNVTTALNLTTAKLSIDYDDTTDGIIDVIDLSHTSSDNNATAADGIGISFELENATGTSTVEEWASIDVLSTTITDGSEDGDFVFSTMLGGTVTEALRIDSSDQSLTIGKNATDADGMQQLRIFPVTASKGSLILKAIANTGDTTVTIQNAAQAAARTLTIPDGGNTTANFLLSQGAQTVAGAQTFTNLFSVDQDDTNDGIRNNLTMSHTSSDDNATVADGVGISIELENATGTSTVEEWFSIDFLSTTITDGSEDGDVAFNAMLGGTVSQALLIDASDQSLTIGANSTDADGIQQLRIFPVTASKGSLLIKSVANTGDTVNTIQNAAHGQATVYTIPDIGQATGNIVLLKASQTTAGELKRADLTEEALAVYGIPIYSLRAADLADMGIAETAGDHYLVLATDVITLYSEVANNETETSVSYFQFILPPEYVAAGDVKIRIKHQLTGAGTDGAGGSTVDFEAWEQDGNGVTGSDLVTTTATTTTKGSWATTDFVVTAAGLVAGDILNIRFTSVVAENATANLQGQYDGLAMLLDIKG
jgi:hypothetical protein